MERFKTMMIDVPHEFRNQKMGGSGKSGAATKYPTLSLNEVIKLPVHNIMDKNSLLLYWTPASLKRESMTVISAWGYSYVTTLYWVKTCKSDPGKVKMGAGYNVRGAVEECWICRKGKVPALGIQKPNVIFAPIGEHSEKPVEAYEFFEPAILKHDLRPCVDIFARKERIGWMPLGNAIDGRDIRDVLAVPIEEWVM